MFEAFVTVISFIIKPQEESTVATKSKLTIQQVDGKVNQKPMMKPISS